MINKKVAWLVGFVVFLITTYFSYSYFGESGSFTSNYKKPTATTTNGEIDSSAPKTEECPINGEYLTEEHKSQWEQRKPLFIMVQNHEQARPQSGLSMADVIYEIVAEGGITRFGAVFYCQAPKVVGSVRSARVHFMKFAQEYNDPLYAHVGGANTPGPADALGLVEELGWDGANDLNQFSVPFPNFWRDYDRLPDRATEHTMYTDPNKLWAYAKTKRDITTEDNKGKPWMQGFEMWKFQDDAAEGSRGNVSTISFGFWSQFASDYSVVWKYDKANNSYKRENGGVAHVDKNTGKQLTAKNVIVVFSDESPANDGYPGGHLLYDLEGEGDAIIFQNGKAIKGTWKKKNPETRMKWYDEDGKEIEIVRGQVWVEVVPEGNKVDYGANVKVTTPTKGAAKKQAAPADAE